METTNLFDNPIDPRTHFFSALSTRAAIIPNDPREILCFDLCGAEAFVVTVVPFSSFLCDNMLGKLLQVIKEQVEGPMSADPWGDEDCA